MQSALAWTQNHPRLPVSRFLARIGFSVSPRVPGRCVHSIAVPCSLRAMDGSRDLGGLAPVFVHVGLRATDGLLVAALLRQAMVALRRGKEPARAGQILLRVGIELGLQWYNKKQQTTKNTQHNTTPSGNSASTAPLRQSGDGQCWR